MKELLKKLMEILFSHDLVIWLYLKIRRRERRIILYHGVSGLEHEKISCQVIAKEEFERQVRHLERFYKDIPLREVVQARDSGRALPANGLTITFDDGYENNYHCAVPLLRRYGFTAAIFVNPKFAEAAQRGERVIQWCDVIDYLVNKDNHLEFIAIFRENGFTIAPSDDVPALKTIMAEALKDVPVGTMEKISGELEKKFAREIAGQKFPTLMNWDQIKELSANDIEIGAHTMSHVTVANLPAARFQEELVEPKKILAEKTGRKIDYFAFPYGGEKHYTRESVAALKRAGYQCAMLVLGAKDDLNDDHFCLNRTSISKADSFGMFKIKVAGILDDVSSLYRYIKKYAS
jgi:peptidoglycan/xylan/chitin deacetylase (PgdA/CDA1 family)